MCNRYPAGLARRSRAGWGHGTLQTTSHPAGQQPWPEGLQFLVAGEIRRLGGTARQSSRPTALATGCAPPPRCCRAPICWHVALPDCRPDGGGCRSNGVTPSNKCGASSASGVGITALNRDWSPTEAVAIWKPTACALKRLIPSIEAARLVGLPIAHSPELGGWVPQANADGGTDIAGLFLCGDGAGIRGAAAAEIQGEITGLKAALILGTKADIPRPFCAATPKPRGLVWR